MVPWSLVQERYIDDCMEETVTIPSIQYFSGNHCVNAVQPEAIDTKWGMVARGNSRNAQKGDMRKRLHLYQFCLQFHLQGEPALPFLFYLFFCPRKMVVHCYSKDVGGMG